MADSHGTDSGVTGMKKYLHIIIKGGLVIFLAAYLTVLYTSDSARNVPIESIAQSMEQDSSITSLNQENRTDLKHHYQTDDRSIDGYFFYKATSPMAVEEICIMKARDNTQAATLLESANSHLSSQKQVFEGYGTDQMALLNNAVVGKKGNYVYYMCGADAQNWRSAFLSLI